MSKDKSFKIKDLTIPHRLILAPMCGITLQPFRQICKENKAGLVFNQMVSAKALSMGDQKSRSMMRYVPSERPFAQQIFGNNAETLVQGTEVIQEQGCDIIDLNLGCPAKKIVNDGGGSALMQDIDKLQDILRRMRRTISGIFTIKIRAGWDEKSKNATEIAQMAEAEGIDAIALHARTRKQGYSGKSDWSFIKHLKENVSIPVIGNGDVVVGSDAHRMIQETGCDGVMTGRGAFARPWIFQEFVEGIDRQPTPQEIKTMVLRQYDYAKGFFGETNGLKIMRKFLCAYTKGIRDGAAFRNEVVRIDHWPLIEEKIHSFYDKAQIH